jgi:phage terminase small subunit
VAGKKGRSGRKRQPRLPEGSRQIERRGPTVQTPEGRVVMPSWLNPQAKAIWGRTVAIVNQMKVMSPADVVALARYCAYVAQWRVVLKAGDAAAALKLEPVIHRLETHFGLTPSSRASLPAPVEQQKPEETKADKFGLVG